MELKWCFSAGIDFERRGFANLDGEGFRLLVDGRRLESIFDGVNDRAKPGGTGITCNALKHLPLIVRGGVGNTVDDNKQGNAVVFVELSPSDSTEIICNILHA